MHSPSGKEGIKQMTLAERLQMPFVSFQRKYIREDSAVNQQQESTLAKIQKRTRNGQKKIPDKKPRPLGHGTSIVPSSHSQSYDGLVQARHMPVAESFNYSLPHPTLRSRIADGNKIFELVGQTLESSGFNSINQVYGLDGEDALSKSTMMKEEFTYKEMEKAQNKPFLGFLDGI